MNLGRVFVKQDSKLLEAIEVKGDVVAMEIKGDTLQYNADAFKVNQDASTKDLVSKMPGIVVDGTGVSANGETIQQVLLDGKRFFGQDPLLSLNTIPAEVVKNVQVFDQQSEQSQFTGVDDGNTTKTMNVVTKEGKKNGKFGKFYGGYGTGEYYNTGFNLNSFKGDKRISLIGMSNNVNIQNFSSEDLAGVGGGGGRRGGSRRGGSSGGFLTGTQSGITKTNAIGLNFSNKLGEKATIESSYFYNLIILQRTLRTGSLLPMEVTIIQQKIVRIPTMKTTGLTCELTIISIRITGWLLDLHLVPKTMKV